MTREPKIYSRLRYSGVVLVAVAGLYLSSLYSYLLFHGLIEIATVAIAFALFLLIWNTQEYQGNSYLSIIGIGYGFIALIDLLHTLAYKGMNVFAGYGANLPTQFWIAARYLQAFTLFCAPLLMKRRIHNSVLVFVYSLMVASLTSSIFLGWFPDCFIDGKGLTLFKIRSEYLITLVLIASLILFYTRRELFQKKVVALIAASIVCTALSEMSFTTYVSVYGFANMVGHFFKLAAFYLIYRAILVTGIKEPFELIFRERVQAEKKLQEYADALTAGNRELQQAYNNLKTAQARLLQQDKLASIGQLAAGVAHEINNPMSFIISNLSCLGRYMEKLTAFVHTYETFMTTCESAISNALSREYHADKVDTICRDVPCLISESLEGAERVRRIIEDLRRFSRVDNTDFCYADINAGLESTLSIMGSELREKAVVTRDYGDVPRVWCNPGEVNQVFLNILLNAVQAIEKTGSIMIATRPEKENVSIEISDTGSGIPPEYLNRIFDPFFTTKDVGQGTGMGLAIVYDIVVNKHGGSISAVSEKGKGTMFTIQLPVRKANAVIDNTNIGEC